MAGLDPIKGNEEIKKELDSAAKSNEEKKDAQKKKGIDLPQATNVNAAMLDNESFRLQYVDPSKVKKDFDVDPLLYKDPKNIEIGGRIYQKDQLAAHKEQIYKDILSLWKDNNKKQVVENMKKLDSSLRLYIMEQLFKDSGINSTSFIDTVKAVWNSPEYVSLYKEYTNSNMIDYEDKDKLLQNFQNKNYLNMVLNVVDRINKEAGKLTIAVRKFDIELISEVSSVEKSLGSINKSKRGLAKIGYDAQAAMSIAKKSVYHLKADSKEQEAEELTDVVMALKNIVNSFLNKADNAAKNSSLSENDKSKLEILKNRLILYKDLINKQIADHINKRYENSGVCLKLSQEAFNELNLSLDSLKAAPLSAEKFCLMEMFNFQSVANVIESNYELSEESVLNKLQKVNYRIHEIIQMDTKERNEQRSQLLKEMRELDKFLEKYRKEKVLSLIKRLDKVGEQKVLQRIDTQIIRYRELMKNIVDDNKDNINFLVALLETAERKRIAQIIHTLKVK